MIYCLVVLPPYLQVGKLHQRHNSDYSRELPILCESILILMSHFLGIANHSTISGLLLFQIDPMPVGTLLKRHRIQADGKLLQLPSRPMSGHKWFPMCHCVAPQHDQKTGNLKGSPNEQLCKWKKNAVIDLCDK